MMKRRKQYLPRFYLDGFADPGQGHLVWVYERGKDSVLKLVSDNRGVGKRYSILDATDDQEDSTSFDNSLASIEEISDPVVDKIRRGVDIGCKERMIVAIFIASCLTRLPEFRNVDVYSGVELIKRLINADVRKHQVGEEELRFMLRGERTIKIGAEYSLPIMTSLTKIVADILYGMKWSFWRSPKGHCFVTSDNPFVYDVPRRLAKAYYRGGLLDAEIRVTFPISRNLMLGCAWNGKEGYQDADVKFVESVNCRVIGSALRYVYAPGEMIG